MPDRNVNSNQMDGGSSAVIDSLRDGRSLFLSLVNSIPACFLRKDRDGRFVFVNENFAALFGKQAQEIVGKTVADFYPKELAEGAREEDEQVMRTGQVLEDVFEDEVDGKLHYYASRKGPVRNESGEVIGIQTIFWDITNQRNAEQALLAEREQLRTAKLAADEANRAKSDFLANMSHEIRTPLNAIIGMTDLLLESQLNPSQHEYLRMIQDSGEALLTLINDILDFSKIEAGKLELDCSTFDIRDSLGDLMKGLGFRAHSKGLELAFRVDDKIPRYLHGDPGRIRQIVVNLVGNAIKFTDAGEIVLEIECLKQSADQVTLRFVVADTGIGIAPEHREKIFQAFEQADASTTRRFGGTGLGLAISSRLVHLMQGRIWVESELGKGSRFLFEIELSIDATPQTERRSDTPASLHGIRVLIVDDNATNRRILKDMLSNWGMNPVTCSGGELALQAMADARAEEDSFKLVISDMNMPDVDGLMLARSIIEQSLLNPANVIILTSGIRPHQSSDLRGLGIPQHLLKPVKQSEMYDAIVSSLSASGYAMSRGKQVAERAESERPTTSLRILLAEDNVVNQKLALGALQKLGHVVTVANDGEQALSLLQEQTFDLVLMDVQMPKMDGLAATRELRRRESGGSAHLPVIAMTAHAMKGDRERCLTAGMDDYLSKPIRLKELSEKLAQYFASADDLPPELLGDEQLEHLPLLAEALANVAGDRALLRELIVVFLDDVPRLMKKATQATKHNNSKALSATAHSIKGSLLFLNPREAIECAERLEQTSAHGDLETARPLLTQLQDLVAQLCDQLRGHSH